MNCAACNYDRAGLADGAPCPECGFSPEALENERRNQVRGSRRVDIVLMLLWMSCTFLGLFLNKTLLFLPLLFLFLAVLGDFNAAPRRMFGSLRVVKYAAAAIGSLMFLAYAGLLVVRLFTGWRLPIP